MLEQFNTRQLYRLILDMLFPPTERSRFVRSLSAKDISNLPPTDDPELTDIHATVSYHDKTVRKIVQAAKYDGDQRAADVMGRVLYDHLLSIYAEERIYTKTITLVPVPLSAKRYKERGFNQSQRIVSAICSTANSSAQLRSQSLLRKKTRTKPQTQLSSQERKDNLQGCFQAKDRCDIADQKLIVIDDVTTTGTTLKEAIKTLKTANPESVLGLAFAH